jgi:hypothetical protein
VRKAAAAKETHPTGGQIGVQRGLRETKVQIGPLAGEDELRRQQVEAFVPREGPGLRIEQQPGEKHGSGGAQVSQLLAFAGRRIVHADYLSMPLRSDAAIADARGRQNPTSEHFAPARVYANHLSHSEIPSGTGTASDYRLRSL